MKIIIAGSRSFDDYRQFVRIVYNCPFKITEIVSGAAKGVDTLAISFARRSKIPLTEFPVTSEEWRILGKSAGIIRNAKMANYADALLAIWDGVSPGTKHMIKIAKDKGLQVCVWRIDLGTFEKNQTTLF